MARNLAIDRLRTRAAERPADTAFLAWRDGGWQPTSWHDYHERVRAFAGALLATGHRPGQPVAILSFNRPGWVIAALGAQYAGGVSIGIYTTSAPDEVAYLVNHCEAHTLVVENPERWLRQVRPVIDELRSVEHVLLLEGAYEVEHPKACAFEAWLERGRATDPDAIEQRFAAVEPEQLATLIYTSGTTGPPKGVMLSHASLAWTCDTVRKLLHVGPEDRLVSYLPLAHVAEQQFTIYGHVSFGPRLYFAESLERLPDNLRELQPTVLFAVPRIWEKIQGKLLEAFAALEGPKAALVRWARSVASRYWERRDGGARVPVPLRAQIALARRLVLDPLRRRIGLGAVRLAVSGAAPMPLDAFRFFRSIDLPIYEVYGQSEDCGPTTFNPPGAVRLGTAGRPLPGTEVRIAEDGEILVRGPHVFLGYYRDPDATAETLVDGWLHSGDVGEFDEAGYLRITDRKKELIITSGGKNIAPQWIEGLCKQMIPLVSQAVLIGEGRKYVAALFTLGPEALERWCRERGLGALPVEQLVTHPTLLETLQRGVDAVNAKLARVEQIKRFHVLPRELSVAAGELTPTMKLKRRVIAERHAEAIEALYRPEPVAAG